MALPQMTEAQRAAALKKAAVTRKKRSEFRAKIKAGKIKVSQFIQSFPGYGKAKAEKIMTEIGIAEDRRLKGLGDNQVAKLIEALD